MAVPPIDRLGKERIGKVKLIRRRLSAREIKLISARGKALVRRSQTLVFLS